MKLTHPKTSQVIEVQDDHTGIYLSQGWVPSTAQPAGPLPDLHDVPPLAGEHTDLGTGSGTDTELDDDTGSDTD